MGKKSVEGEGTAMRHARVVLSKQHLQQLMGGGALTIRLRNIAGEAQLLELTSVLRENSPLNKQLLEQYNALMGKISDLLDKPFKKGGAAANASKQPSK